MSNVSKRRREGSRPKLKTMGDHKEFVKRITKSLYYGHLPNIPCLSLPVTEISCAVWSETQRGRSLRRLHVDAAARVARGACVSPCALVLALLYLERLHACRPHYLHQAAPRDLFLISLMVGNKFLQDDGEEEEVISSEWAASGELDVKQLNKLELEFLDAMDWNIFVKEESFERRLCWLERQVAVRQGKARGFFTYGDLSAACDRPRATELVRALAAACLALSAAAVAWLASALLVSACLPLPLPPRTPLQTTRAPLDAAPRALPTFLNNATVEFAIDALAEELAARERVSCSCCGEWRRHHRRDESARPRREEAAAARASGGWWWSRGAALGCLYWSTLVSPLQRWLERVAEYADLRSDALRPPPPPPPPAPHWLNLSKLSALLVTVSDR